MYRTAKKENGYTLDGQMLSVSKGLTPLEIEDYIPYLCMKERKGESISYQSINLFKL
jgi:hypothetical protein